MVVFTSRHGVAVLLNQQSGIGIAAILTAAAFFVLLSLDRGLLQAHRAYRPLAVNLLVEMGVPGWSPLVLVAAGFGPSGAAVGVLIGEVVAAAHARSAVGAGLGRAGQAPAPGRRRQLGGVAAPRPLLDRPALGAPHGRDRPGRWPRCPSPWWPCSRTSTCSSSVATTRRTAGPMRRCRCTSKAIVFGAVVLGGYLLPEAAIRWRQGGHALRQLAVVLVLLAVPSVLLLAVAARGARQLL